MSIEILAAFTLGATTVFYQTDPATGQVGLELCPTSMVASRVAHEEHYFTPEQQSLPEQWRHPLRVNVDSLVQIKCVGDDSPGGFSQGRTMRNGESTLSLRYDHQGVVKSGDLTTIVTTLRSPRGYTCEHRVAWHEGDPGLTISTVFHNSTAQPITLEMLASFSLGNVTPFDARDAPGRLVLHRFRSGWSSEGRLESLPFEQIGLEPTWLPAKASSERFGQIGSVPTNGFFPFVAVEDTQAHVLWGAQLAWAGSWQMEVYRRYNTAAISGGLADREFGQWQKIIPPGGSFETPPAYVATATGDVDDLCQKLTAMQHRAADTQPAIETDLPIVFNEWCTSWGNPTQESLLAIADRLKGTPTKYLVIDAGWYAPGTGSWSAGQGDWVPSQKLYPDGLAATAAAIRARGLVPGLWFEFEVTGKDSAAYQLVEHQLKRDGQPLSVDGRHFWDMRDPYVIDYLDRKVIGQLRDAGFGYLKVDYNATIGVGADGTESPGEKLRQNIEGTQQFFRRVRQQLPELVIENCASGGHRLEPSMMGLTAMGSFSDAHETRDIPIIAANLQRLILPRQSQVWAVLRGYDSAQRIGYSLAATFLGRMCVSGDITALTDAQWAQVLRAQYLYRQVVPVIKHGSSRRYGPPMVSWHHPAGWQAVVREGDDRQAALVVAHSFGSPVPEAIEIPLPPGSAWKLADSLRVEGSALEVRGGKLLWKPHGEFDSAVVWLKP